MVNSNVVSVTASVPPPPPGMGTLLIDTSPVKGAVFVNQVSQGLAPVIIHVAEGAHLVSFGSVSVAYTTPSPQSVDVGEGETVSVLGIYVPTTIPNWLPYLVFGGGVLALATALIASEKGG